MSEMHTQSSHKAQQLAHFYDLEYGSYTDDINFYVQHAQAMDPNKKLPVLELGCGTGRIAIALAQSGIQVTALDTSDAMLEICAKRAQSKGVDKKISLVQTDMRNLEHLPYAPFNMAF